LEEEEVEEEERSSGPVSARRAAISIEGDF
jgi:hypothetical protein